MNDEYNPGTFLKQLLPHLTVGIDIEINVGFSFMGVQYRFWNQVTVISLQLKIYVQSRESFINERKRWILLKNFKRKIIEIFSKKHFYHQNPEKDLQIPESVLTVLWRVIYGYLNSPEMLNYSDGENR